MNPFDHKFDQFIVKLVCLTGILLLALAIATNVYAQTVSWNEALVEGQPPTTYTDGTPIKATGEDSISGYRFNRGTCNGDQFDQSVEQVISPSTSYKFTNLLPGKHCFTVYARLNSGAESPTSPVGSKIILAQTPTTPVPPPVVSTGKPFCTIDGIGTTGGTRPLYHSSENGGRGAKIRDVPVGPLTGPKVGTPFPYPVYQCSCADIRQWKEGLYSHVDALGGYMANCKVRGFLQ